MTHQQETEMKDRNDNPAHTEAREDIIELGAVSTETMGIGVGREFLTEGENPLAGIADE